MDRVDPKTMLFILNCLSTVARFLPHSNPNYLDLLKLPFFKTMGECKLVLDKQLARAKGQLENEERSILSAAMPYLEAILDCPVGKNLLQEEKNTVTILQAMIEVGEYHDFGTWVQRSMATMSSKVILLLLQAKQKMPIVAEPTRPTGK